MLASTLFFSTLIVQRATAAFYYPDIQTSLLEHILVDNWGAYASNFSSAITPCTRYVTQTGSAALNSGRTTAAQWMRVLFHDFITADVSAGTGGVDASIGFETMRAENSGSAFNDSFTFWRPWVTEQVSSTCLTSNVSCTFSIPKELTMYQWPISSPSAPLCPTIFAAAQISPTALAALMQQLPDSLPAFQRQKRR
jgi:hypothetical protein